MRREQNVILFSAGESVRNKKVEWIQNYLRDKGIHCLSWNELFRGANSAEQISLLPILMKKIPTFDFALILAEGVDQVTMRQGTEAYSAMRDNVVFELGLCVMALGAERVILLAEEGVRLVDDLSAFGKIGLTHISYAKEDGLAIPAAKLHAIIDAKARSLGERFYEQLDQVIAHINGNADIVSPVFVGAAVSSAEAYFTNFIVRLLEHIEEPIYPEKGGEPFTLSLAPEVQIVLPASVDSMTSGGISAYYERVGADTFFLQRAGARGLSFRGKLQDGKLTVIDVPTSVTASYSVVSSILNIDSDEAYDPEAEERFATKEMDIYEYTLKKLFTPAVASARLGYIADREKKERIIRALGKIRVLRAERRG